MITALVIGDPHFKISNSTDTELLITNLKRIAHETNPTFIVCLGDLLDRHETINVYPLDRATRFLKMLKTIAPTYLLIGNHDRPNNSNFLTSIHPFTAHKEWDGLTVVDTVIERTIGGHRFVFVPYVPPGRFREALEQCQVVPDGATAIFAHQEFRGVQMGAICSDIGDFWDPDESLVIDGHIHEAHWSQSNICCVGTPFQQSFGESEDKSVMFFSWSETGMEFLTRTTEIPAKKVVHLRLADLDGFEVPPEATEYWKIVLHGTSSEMKYINRHPKVTQWKERRIRISNQTDVVTSKSSMINISIHQPYLDSLSNEIKKRNLLPLVSLIAELFQN